MRRAGLRPREVMPVSGQACDSCGCSTWCSSAWYVEAMLGLEVWANNLYQAILAPARAGHDGHQHG